MDRFFAPLEVKFAADALPGMFKGYGAVFSNVDYYGDVIAPGAFKATLADFEKSGRMPPMLSQHGGLFGSDIMPIGVWTALREDGKGLWAEGKFADTPRGQEAYSLVKMQPRAALDGLSIGYLAKEFSVGLKPGQPRRTLKSVDLLEISLVTMPGNEKARIRAVKACGEIETIRDFEAFLRDVGGFSRAQAKAIAASGFKTFPDHRDDAGMDNDVAALAARFRALRPAV